MQDKYKRYNDLDKLRNALRQAEQHATWMLQGYLNAEGAEEALEGFVAAVDTEAKGYFAKAVESLAEDLEKVSEPPEPSEPKKVTRKAATKSTE